MKEGMQKKLMTHYGQYNPFFMADTFDKNTRSLIMSKIKNKNTKPELLLRKSLWHNGLKGYRINYNLKGKPDIVYPRKKVAIFVDGCFWHGCPKCYRRPKSNTDYWDKKIQKNIERDKSINIFLTNNNWLILRFWEHEIKNNLLDCILKVEEVLKLKRTK